MSLACVTSFFSKCRQLSPWEWVELEIEGLELELSEAGLGLYSVPISTL